MRPKLCEWPLCFFGVNLLLTLVTVIFPYVHNAFLKWNVLNHLNLAGEMNLATWWSGGTLLLCSWLAYQLSTRDPQGKLAWIIVAVIFALLSFDEVGSLHERAANDARGFALLAVAALSGSIALLMAGWALWSHTPNKRSVLVLFVGLALLASAAPNEFLEHRLHWPLYLIGPRVGFEEGLELAGSLVCLFGITSYHLPSPAKRVWAELTPEAARLPLLAPYLAAAYGLHLIIAWVVVRYVTIDFRGNPAVWYVMAVYFVLALTLASNIWTGPVSARRRALLLTVFFMLLSAGSLYFLLPRFNSKIHAVGVLADPTLRMLSQLFVTAFLHYWSRRTSLRTAFMFVFMAIAIGLSRYFPGQMSIYNVSGLLALITALAFLPVPHNDLTRT